MYRVLSIEPAAGSPEAEASRSPASQSVAIRVAHDIEEALSLTRAQKCDVLVVSAAMPDDAALEIVRTVASAEPGVRILVKDLAEANQPAARYVEAGAVGWLL